MFLLQLSLGALVDATFKFDLKIQGDQYMFVFFCAPDCQYCSSLLDSYEDIVDYFEDYDDEIIIAHANCRIKPEICAKHNITQHPSWVLYRNGKQVGEYKGPRHTFVQIEWLKTVTGIGLVSDIKQ